jgi:acyl carrier protein
VLASRSGPAAAGTAVLAAELARAGTAVSVSACDTASRDQVSGLCEWIGGNGPELRSVFHAAGTAPGQPVADLTVPALAEVLAAKAAGAGYLDEATAGLELDGFVLFSSGAAAWGSGGLGGYAAANAHLDALAAARHAAGQPATSIAWGLWDGGGLGAGQGGEQLHRMGVRLMDPARAMAALGQVLDAGEILAVVADVDWDRFTPVFTLHRPSPLISAIPETTRALATPAPPAAGQGGLALRLAGLPASGQEQLLTDSVRAEAAAVLGHGSAAAVEPGRAFKDLGFDSVTAVEFRDRLSTATGLTLPSTLIFDYPTPVTAARYLRAQITGHGADYRSALEELDRLKAALSAISRDSDGRPRIVARLEAIMKEFRTETIDSVSAGQDLESATDDEMFDLVEIELNSPDFDTP